MKLEILQENLSSALNQIHRVIPNKPQLPILSSILISAEENKITLAATDLYVGIKTSVPGKVTKPTDIAVPGRIFYNSITSLNPGKISLSLDGDTLTISSSSNTTTIQCLDPEEFPEFPKLKGEEYSLEATSIEKIQDMVSFSASIDLTRPVLTSLLFQFNQDGLLVVGTDGFRLATLRLPAEKKKSEAQFLVPAKAMVEAAKIILVQEIEKVKLSVSSELKQAVIKIGSTQLYIRLIEGEYPPFQRIIPSDFSVEVELDGVEFESQLKRAQVFARESSNIIRLEVEEGEFKIMAFSPTYGKQEGKMQAEMIKGNKGEIAFNSKYLLDFISALKPEKIRFYMNESLTPAMFRPVNQKDYQYIAMPFRVNE
jgi:DNA polymerase III subunit beta